LYLDREHDLADHAADRGRVVVLHDLADPAQAERMEARIAELSPDNHRRKGKKK